MSLIVTRSSGNLSADRRYAWGAAAAQAGDHIAAADLFEQTLELVPGFAAAAFALGLAKDNLGDIANAVWAFAQALALDPADEQGAALQLARLGHGHTPAIAPPAYVRELFDAYAPRFDAHLVTKLGYRAPQVLAQLVHSVGPRAFGIVLDLGCGTGLAGEVFRAQCTHLVGVDLSPRMVELAQGKAIYNRLNVADINDFLRAEPPQSASLVLAADVFVYMGDLGQTLAFSHKALQPGGLVAFTVQTGDGDYQLGDDLRYTHSLQYLRATALGAGLVMLASQPISTRKDRGHDVPGLAIVLARPA